MSSDYEVIKIDQAGEADVKKAAQPIEKSTFPIPYSDWKQKNKVSQVYNLPIEFCFFRKDNGRIKSEVLSYEKEEGIIINEKDEDTQKLLQNFLSKSDDKKNIELKKYLKEEGQIEPVYDDLDAYQKKRDAEREAELEKARAKQKDQFKFNYVKPRINWSIYGGWVNPHEPINKGKLGSSQGWRVENPGRSYY